MKTSKYLYTLAASALFLAGNVYAADYEYTPAASSAGMAWSTVDWVGATQEEPLPQSTSTVLINIGDADNPFLIDGAYTIGNLNISGNSDVLLSGAGNSLTTTFTAAPYGDVILNNDATLTVSDGAAINIANGMSLKVRNNSSVVFDGATFTGGLYEVVNSLTFRNGATWNPKGYQTQIQNANILVQDSSIVGGINFGNGQTGSNFKHLTLDNSTWNANNGGLNIAGVVEVLNGSSVSNTPHFNIGHDGDMSAGLYKLVVRGTDAETRSSVAGSNLWLNVGSGSQSIMSFEGYTDATFGGARPTAKHTGGDMSIIFSGNSNNFTVGNFTEYGTSRDNYLLASGNWIITTSHMDGENEVLATNTTFSETASFAIHNSKAEGGSTIVAGVDWAGATNTFSVASNTAIDHDLNAGGSSVKYITVRDGATMNLHNTYVGSEENASNSGKSGTALLTASGTDTTLGITGSLNLRNSIYSDATTENYVTVSDGAAMSVSGAINLATSSASAGGKSVLELNGATSSLTFGSMSIGNADATGGEAWLKVLNGATLAIHNFSLNADSDTGANARFGVLVDNSNITGGWQMGDGSRSKFLTLQNQSTWNAGGGINTAGIVKVLESSISNSEHFNVGWENGKVSGYNELYLQGSSTTPSTINITNFWINANSGSQSIVYQDGYSSVAATKIDSGSAFTGADVQWIFQGSNNSLTISGDSRWGDNLKNKTESGSWLMTTAQEGTSGETFATNTSFTINNLTLRGSDVANNDFVAKLDWAGATNAFTANNDLNIYPSKGNADNAHSIAIFRENSTANIGRYIRVGQGEMVSGTAELRVESGAALTHANNFDVINSTVAGATTKSKVVVDGGTIARTGGYLRIGVGTSNQNAIEGDASVEIKNTTVNYGGSVLLAGSSVSDASAYNNTASLIIDSADFTMTGELYMGHQQDGGTNIYGGVANLILRGENASFTSSNKGWYGGYNTTTHGGERNVVVSGTNNSMYFKESYQQNGQGTQQGGSSSTSITGAGHTFSVQNIYIGSTSSTAGTNTFYVKSDSAENKNLIEFNNGGYTLSVRGSTVADSTIANSFEVAGNTIMVRDTGGSFNIEVGTSSLKGGSASFIISGENNEINAYNVNIGNANSEGGSALFKIDGSTHIVNADAQLTFSGSGLDPQTATLAFVADANGISTFNANTVGTFSGFLDIDFSKYAAQTLDPMEFTIISANNSWTTSSNYLVSDNNEYVNVTKANEDDTWEILKNGNDLILSYSSSVVIPEPSTYAAIFGALALAFAAYRRRK
ncbi:MAG: PEP-CTERM sorting domain-containing protein [Opitutales bacterium]|nr:PEP-CTERM sorting domain-containing protein [Opitutales bacterium]